eukprot:jgi/Galph1/2636/GphlegSOOS_G1297.1
MKVKALSRSEREWDPYISGGAGSGIARKLHNPDPNLHPLERAREYKRALNAVKLDKIFAKPFLFALEGHIEGIYSLARSRSDVSLAVSSSADGELRLWDLGKRRCLWSKDAHSSFVRGVCFLNGDKGFLSCGNDKTIKWWKMEAGIVNCTEPVVYTTRVAASSIDSHWKESVFASGGEGIDLWTFQRSEPYLHLSWETETVHSIRFHPVEHNLLIGCGSDRSLTLHDIRSETAIRKLVLKMQSNDVSWNPVEPFVFTAANEDSNLYTFDIRYMKHATKVHSDHVSAVMSVDYSPTGREFASGSYDRTIRIFGAHDKLSREVYHTKRMQRVFSVEYSGDASYILSGSDDGIVRVWKSESSKPLKPLLRNERDKLEYERKLKERYGFLPDVRKIARQRYLPRQIHKMKQQKAEMKKSRDRKERNRRIHSKVETTPQPLTEKRQVIVAEVE